MNIYHVILYSGIHIIITCCSPTEHPRLFPWKTRRALRAELARAGHPQGRWRDSPWENNPTRWGPPEMFVGL